MTSADGMPRAINIPELHINIEGLKRHSFMCVFVPEPSLSAEDRKLRAWLLHTVASAARHYSKARELVQLQDNADQKRDGGAIFYILDVSEQAEDCIMATYRVCSALRRMGKFEPAIKFSTKCSEHIEELRSLRNQFDHMHSQIVASETGSGPISIVFGDEGKTIKFRKLKMQTAKLHKIIECAFRTISTLYPEFDSNSTPEAGGPMKLTMTATISITDGNSGQQIIE